MQFPPAQWNVAKIWPLTERQAQGFAWLSSTPASILAFCLIACFLPPCAAASEHLASPSPPAGNPLHAWEFVLIGIFGYGVAWMIFVKDFRRYKGLHLLLFRSGYAWVFLIFVTAATFAIDVLALQFLQRFELHAWAMHLALGLGHPIASSVVTKASPYLLAFIPAAPEIRERDDAAEDLEEEEKPLSEMNVIFDNIREFLDNQRNSVVQKWTTVYNWEKIKFVADMLIEDRVTSHIITHKKGEQLKKDVEQFAPCADVLTDRKLKYRALLKLTNLSSVQDIRSRLERP